MEKSSRSLSNQSCQAAAGRSPNQPERITSTLNLRTTQNYVLFLLSCFRTRMSGSFRVQNALALSYGRQARKREKKGRQSESANIGTALLTNDGACSMQQVLLGFGVGLPHFCFEILAILAMDGPDETSTRKYPATSRNSIETCPASSQVFQVSLTLCRPRRSRERVALHFPQWNGARLVRLSPIPNPQLHHSLQYPFL